MSLKLPTKRKAATLDHSSDKLLLIDSDIVAYRVSAAIEKDKHTYRHPISIVEDNIDSVVASIMEATKSRNVMMCLSSELNFRKTLYTDYKANRKSLQQPEYLSAALKYVASQYPSIGFWGYEADDVLAVLAYENMQDVIIASIDKDLKQVSSTHYNIMHKTISYIGYYEALDSLLKQIIVGDTIDNIKGMKGRGIKYAEKFCEMYGTPVSEGELIASLAQAFINDCKYDSEEMALAELAKAYNCIKLQTSRNCPKILNNNLELVEYAIPSAYSSNAAKQE